MKLKNSFFYTLREDVKDEDSKSSNLLVRAGYIKKSSSGVYMMLPLGLRVMQNIDQIIREEMDAIDCQELEMPSLIPEDVYKASGRREGFGNSMFTLKDRKGMPYALGPTHEEMFVLAAKSAVRSYKDLPFSLYQIQTKFRDEPRPRYGLIRVREFKMKDSYTFDKDLAGLDASYKLQFDAYRRIIDRMHIDYKIVRADTGVMGGLLSEEFQAITPLGEDTIVLCDSCDFASNTEVAKCVAEVANEEAHLEKEMVETPNARTIEEVVAFLNQPVKKFVKTLIYSIDGKPVAVMVRGDRDVNETKLRKLYGATEVELAEPEVVMDVTSAQVGFAGPIDIKCELVCDEEVSKMHNFIAGANKTGYHYVNLNMNDFEVAHIADLRNIMENDVCPCCGGKIKFAQGIEVANTFKLGTKYSQALDLQYLDENNKLNDVWMGCYGIGPARAMAALVEQTADENGLNWPVDLAPYPVAIVVINTKDDTQNEVANDIYTALRKQGVQSILDDRKERPGVKFKDMDLIGIPLRITVGRGAKDGVVEFKHRGGEAVELQVSEIVDRIKQEIEDAKVKIDY